MRLENVSASIPAAFRGAEHRSAIEEAVARARAAGVEVLVVVLGAGAPRPRVTLRREGDAWAVESTFGAPFRVRHGKGVAYLSALLAHPDEDLHVLVLVGAEHRGGDAGPVLDATARAQYRARLESLEYEAAVAEEHEDGERAHGKRAEIEALARELARALGIGGRARRAASDVERARINVQRRIKSAIEAIAAHDAALARYLRASVTTGTTCRFSP